MSDTKQTTHTARQAGRATPAMYFHRDADARAVAAHVGCDEKTVRRWAGLASAEGDYACPHDRDERGRLWFNVDEVQLWMERTRRGGDADGRTACSSMTCSGSSTCRTGSTPCSTFDHYPTPGEPFTFDPENLPHSFSPLEREVAYGDRTLSRDELREYIEATVKMKLRLQERLWRLKRSISTGQRTSGATASRMKVSSVKRSRCTTSTFDASRTRRTASSRETTTATQYRPRIKGNRNDHRQHATDRRPEGTGRSCPDVSADRGRREKSSSSSSGC